jgi:serine phosphatase RsbU (regulator of sigma subunit)
MPLFSEEDLTRAEIKEELRYAVSTGAVLLGFFLFVSLLKLIFRDAVATGLLVCLAVWFLANLGFAALLRRQTSLRAIDRLNLAYLTWEVVLLTVIVHYVGGVAWVGVIFYGLTVGYSGIGLPKGYGYIIAGAACLLFSGLALLEFFGVVPHQDFIVSGLSLHRNLGWVIVTVLSSCAAIMYTAYTGSTIGGILRQRQEDLRVAYQEKARELELARSVQARFLKEPPAIPGLDIAAVNLPAAEVSGDFYDFLPAGDGRHLLVVGDVAGHGIPAALTMSAAMMAMELSLRSANGNGSKPPASELMRRLVQEVDNFLTNRIGGESFITTFLALYDEREELLITLNLGHPHVLAYLAMNGKVVQLRGKGDGFLPLMASRYVSSAGGTEKDPKPWPLRVQPGDTLVLYTDGLVEARNGKEEYGMKRLRGKVKDLGNKSAQEIAAGLLADVRAFTGGREQRDDITLVVVKRMGQ